MEPKNQVISTTCCKVMAKYISIYFDMFYEKLVGTGLQPAGSKTKIWYALHSAAFSLGECQWKKNMSHFLQVNLFQTKIFEVHFHFLLHIWVQVDFFYTNLLIDETQLYHYLFGINVWITFVWDSMFEDICAAEFVFL